MTFSSRLISAGKATLPQEQIRICLDPREGATPHGGLDNFPFAFSDTLTDFTIEVRVSECLQEANKDKENFCKTGPSAASVKLRDETINYNCQDFKACRPAYLSHLEELALRGWPSLSSHTDTLHTTTELKSMEMWMFIPGVFDGLISPIDELYRSYGLPVAPRQDEDGANEIHMLGGCPVLETLFKWKQQQRQQEQRSTGPLPTTGADTN
ncbi:MAG: hypothetical protein J3R72DRAFT_528836 [Linnemannia gamsii]|nr:MAG: hypothetical protein J3R72DRAFT_528836 [Linnemannia gamsii]